MWVLAAETDLPSAFERWVKLAADYGASWVFTVGTLLLILYVSVSLVNLVKKWAPLWVQSSMDSQKRVAEAVESVVEDLRCVHDSTHALRSGMRQLTRAARTHGKKLDKPWPSDVMVQLQQAEETFDDKNQHQRRFPDGTE